MAPDSVNIRPRVLLAEDHAETAEQLRALLGQIRRVASVGDGGALIDAAERLSLT